MPDRTPPTAACRVNQQPVRQREFHDSSSTGVSKRAPSSRRAAVRSISRSGRSTEVAATSGRTATKTIGSRSPAKPESGYHQL